jgi:hypothetical protein
MRAITSQGIANEILGSQAGQNGVDYVSGVTTQYGNWFAIQIVEEATFDKLNGFQSGAPLGDTFPAGLIFYGTFDFFRLTKGRVIAYRSASA